MDAVLRGVSQHIKKSRAFAVYRRFFSIDEIEQDIALHWVQGALLLGFFVTFWGWFYKGGNGTDVFAGAGYTCWPFWQNCGGWHVLTALPFGYSQPLVYMGLFAVMAGAVYLMHLKEWAFAHFATLILLLAKTYFMAIDYEFKANYDYYHWIFAFIFVFFPHKRFFTQLSIVVLYFLSTSSKMSSGWVLGNYFTTMRTGLPIFPRGTEAFFTNLVIIEEMFGAWLLFSANRVVQRLELGFYILFHLYSGLLVGFFYPMIVMPVLISVFGPWFTPYKRVPLDRRSIAGWLLIAAFVVLQAIPVLIPGDERMTNEGNFYSMYMFEANHQCAVTVHDAQGHVLMRDDTLNARMRCDAYEEWFKAKARFCGTISGPVGMTIDHSINGSAFYRIVDVPDICALSYKPFSHNDWIKDETTAPVVGYPHLNFYN